MGPVFVVMPLVFAQGLQEMRLVPDERAVEQFVGARLDPSFDHGVHPGRAYAAENDMDSGVGEDRVEQRRVLAIAVSDEEAGPAAGVFEVHD